MTAKIRPSKGAPYARILPPEKLPLVGLPQVTPAAPVFADGGSD